MFVTNYKWSSKFIRHLHVQVSLVSGRLHIANRLECGWLALLISCDVQQTTAGILVSAASQLISTRAGVLCQQSERVLLSTSSLIPIDRITVTTPQNKIESRGIWGYGGFTLLEIFLCYFRQGEFSEDFS